MSEVQAMLGDATVVTVAGPRLDVACAQGFRREMTDLIDNGATYLVFDMSQVEFMDSSGLGAVVGVMKSMGKKGRIELACLQPTVRKVFRLTRMDQVFRIHNALPAG